VRGELLKRGIDRKQIDAAMEQAPDETAAAREVAEKYLSRNKRLEPVVLKRRLYALLARRGFSLDTIRRVMNAPDLEV
jgi:SOS response regulatory protein OraA/RecX